MSLHSTIEDIIFPKNRISYFTEIYTKLEPKLVSINYLTLHNLPPVRGGSGYKLCGGEEDNINHILFECAALSGVWRLMRNWLSTLIYKILTVKQYN